MARSAVAYQSPNAQTHGGPVNGNRFDKLVQGFELILEGLGVEAGPHTVDTPKRAAKAWWDELCSGLTQDKPKITAFPSNVNSMVVSRGIPIRSICAHHLLPFAGTATIAYIPGNGKILGLSKLSRLAEYWSRRPQVQEELTEQIADAVASYVMSGKKGGVGVIIQARHMCMEMRGVLHPSDMVTSALRGLIKNRPEVRAEFLKFANGDAK